MKFNIKSAGVNYIVDAKSELDAVKKLKDAKKRKLNDSWLGKNVSTQLGTGSVIDYKEILEKGKIKRIWSVKLDNTGDIVNTSWITFNGFKYDSALRDYSYAEAITGALKRKLGNGVVKANTYTGYGSIGNNVYAYVKLPKNKVESEAGDVLRRYSAKAEADGSDTKIVPINDSAINDAKTLWLVNIGQNKPIMKVYASSAKRAKEYFEEQGHTVGAVSKSLNTPMTTNGIPTADSKVKDSAINDSNKLSKLAYDFAQMGNYFDRANSAHSRNILAKEDETKLAEFYNLGLQVYNQLVFEIENMKRVGKKDRDVWDWSNIVALINDGMERLYWTGEAKCKLLYNKLKPVISEYKNLSVKDSAINDSKITDRDSVDAQHMSEYGWTIEADLPRTVYWNAVDELAGKLKSEEEYKREIVKLAKKKFEEAIVDIKREFEKIIANGRKKTSLFESWVGEQATLIMKKQLEKK